MLCLLLASSFHFTVGLVQKQTTLSAQVVSQNGASIAHNNATAQISENTYNVIVKSLDDIGYDMLLSLDSSWSFQASIISSITLTINGNTPYPDKDTDLLLVFSVNNLQYFSFFIHLDYTHNLKSRIYSSISNQSITTPVSEWISNNAINSRWDRISNNNSWLIIPDWNKQAIWPLQFVIINNPITNHIIFEFYHNMTQHTQQYATGYTFDGVFVANKQIDIYIMGDSYGETYDLSSFNIKSSYYNSDSPTLAPTFIPAPFPTPIPTPMQTNSYPIANETDHDYTISLIIGFKYIFSLVELNKITMIVQHLIVTSNDINCREWVKWSVTTTPNITIINATIYLCDEYTQNKLLVASHDGSLQRDIINNINQEIENVHLIANKTWLEANRINILSPNPLKTTYLMNDTLLDKTIENSIEKQFMYPDNYYFWMILFVTFPIVTCCTFLAYLKIRTRKQLRHRHSDLQKQTTIQPMQQMQQQSRNVSIVEESYEESDEIPYYLSKHSSKLYKIRSYNKPRLSIMINNRSARSATTTSVASTSAISARIYTYKTRGISEDMYDRNSNGITSQGAVASVVSEISHSDNDLYDKANESHPKLSMASRVTTNAYPNVTVLRPQIPQEWPAYAYKLPTHKFKKQQGL